MLVRGAGSIGTQTLDIVKEHGDRFEVVALAAGGNVALLAEQVCPATTLRLSTAEQEAVIAELFMLPVYKPWAASDWMG